MENQPSMTMGHSTFTPNEEEAASRGSDHRFLFGMLFGILVALVFAPKTGEETREQIKEWSILLTERVRGLMTGERPEESGETMELPSI